MVGLDAGRAVRLGAVPVAVGEIAGVGADLLLVAAADFTTVPAGIPVLVLDAPDEPEGRAALLDAGAADIVGREADPVEVCARVRAILRRASPLVCADLAIDAARRRVSRGGRSIALHPREFAVLAHLARHRDRVVTRAALYAAVWQRDFDPGTNVVAVAVSRLRAKLESEGGRLIHTVADGYMLSAVAGA
jgi:two-component system OmpR family response regulator